MSETSVAIRFTLNGAERSASVKPNLNLADLLREDFGLGGVKIGCDQGVCGACTVLADGIPMAACASFA